MVQREAHAIAVRREEKLVHVNAITAVGVAHVHGHVTHCVTLRTPATSSAEAPLVLRPEIGNRGVRHTETQKQWDARDMIPNMR